jgi:hypothetical protein
MEIKFTIEDAGVAGLPVPHYALLLAIAQSGYEKISDIVHVTHLAPEAIEKMLRDVGYVDIHHAESVYDTTILFTESGRRLFELDKFKSIAPQVIEIWNNVNKERRRVAPYKAVIDGVCKADKSITLTSFESVIVHKAETWGRDENMEIYNRPETIFKSVRRFLVYLEDARVYWQKQHKRESYF